NETAKFDPVVLHFDAKYRLTVLEDLFGESEETLVAASEAQRSDLLKMHAYRDAIRRSVGAFVLYPGTEKRIFQEYEEILPGLGAFALRPTLSGPATGITRLREFLSGVLDHVALQLT